MYCKRPSVFLNMFCNMICASRMGIKKETANHAIGNFFRLRSFFELSYLDSNQDKQNQNLLCYHYTIGQSSCASFRKSGAKIEVFLYPCKLLMYFLFCDEQEVVLLAALYEQVLVVEQVCGCDFLIEGCKFLLVERYATTLCHLAHLAF